MSKLLRKKTPSYINTSPIKDSWTFIQKIWKYYRWELFAVLSFIVFIVCYFLKENNEYKGLYYDTSLINKKKRGTKKHETECRRILESKFKLPFSSVRPNFLKNPKTGKNLELDMYSPHLKLALEYQGAQHRTYTPFFHKSIDDFNSQVERDNYKKQKCIDEGIDLICVPDTVKYEDLASYIDKELRRLKRIN
jgi:hypothetical protein